MTMPRKMTVNNSGGICMPVKAGMLERMFVKHLACTAMHPNPADEYGKTDKRIRYKGGQR